MRGGFFLGLGLACCAACGTAAECLEQHGRTFRVGPNPSAMLAADMNGDGLPEIITADVGMLGDPREESPAHDQLSYLVAHGDLDYATVQVPAVGYAPYCLAAANLDALKAPDLVVGAFMAVRPRDVTLLRNLSEHRFEPHYFRVPETEELPYRRMRDGDGAPVFTTPGITDLAVRDFDGDGFRDVIAAGWASDVLAYLPGAPETYLGPARFFKAEGGPRSLAVADFDGDKRLDVAVALYAAGRVGLWAGGGEAGFAEAGAFATRGRLPHCIEAADFNGDGRLDLAVSHCYTDDSIVLFYGGEEAFAFSVSQEILLGEDRELLEHEIRDLAVGDFNGDGRLDLAAACSASRTVAVLLNISKDAALPQVFERETHEFEKGRPRALAAADLDADEKDDLAVALWDENCVVLFTQK